MCETRRASVGIGALIGSQLAHLAENLPGHQTYITEKIYLLRDTTTSNGVVGRAVPMLSHLGTAFQILHKLRAGMVRPGRDRIGGQPRDHVEIDEFMGRRQDAGRGPRRP